MAPSSGPGESARGSEDGDEGRILSVEYLGTNADTVAEETRRVKDEQDEETHRWQDHRGNSWNVDADGTMEVVDDEVDDVKPELNLEDVGAGVHK